MSSNLLGTTRVLHCFHTLSKQRSRTVLSRYFGLKGKDYLQNLQCIPQPSAAMSTTAESPCHKVKINSQVFQDIFIPELITLRDVCERNDMEIRIAGGAVRDILLNTVPHDIDFATTAHPQRMVEIFNKEGIRILEYGSRALGHGTVSVRINDTINYEITTTRSDVLTDGRHASVEFHTDWRKDANRRDLTINSIFLGLDGTLYDYFNGYNDLMDKRVLFVGEAHDRINEDFLRIMRYFRFYGRIKADPEDHDPRTLEVIGQNAEGLKGVAGERIWVELKKIVAGHFADHQIVHIVELGVAEHIGLPADADTKEFAAVYERSAKYDITEAALLSSLFANKQQVDDFHTRLRVSKLEYTTALFIVEQRDLHKKGKLKYFQDMIVDSADRKLCRLRCIQLAAYVDDKELYDELMSWTIPNLPFSATVLLEAGVPKGKKIAKGIQLVKQKWKDSNYQSTSDELIEYAQSLVKSGDLT